MILGITNESTWGIRRRRTTKPRKLKTRAGSKIDGKRRLSPYNGHVHRYENELYPKADAVDFYDLKAGL